MVVSFLDNRYFLSVCCGLLFGQSEATGVRFKVVFDYAWREMILEPNKNFGQPFLYDMSGLYLIMNIDKPGTFRVAHVVKGSLSKSAGVLKGDVLLQVNKKSASQYDYEQIKNVFKQARKTVILHILRDGSPLKITLKLKKLL